MGAVAGKEGYVWVEEIGLVGTRLCADHRSLESLEVEKLTKLNAANWVVKDRKEGIIAEEMDDFFSGNRLIKESRKYQGCRAGHGGVSTFEGA